MAAKTNEIRLEYPIEYDGQTFEVVTLRRAKVRDIEEIDKARDQGDMAVAIISISCLTGLPVEIVREMDADDMTAISEAMQDFLPKAPINQDGAA